MPIYVAQPCIKVSSASNVKLRPKRHDINLDEIQSFVKVVQTAILTFLFILNP